MNRIIKIIFFLVLSHFLLNLNAAMGQEKIKIGLLIPMTGLNKELGESIIKAVRLAVKDIDSDLIEIIPKDTNTKPEKTLQSALELKDRGIKIVIGPVFHKSLLYLDQVQDLTFLSLTNKTLDLPSNVISAGINSTSQFNTIKKFLQINEIKKTLFLTPIKDYEFEIKEGIKKSKIKIFKEYAYNSDPTKLTNQIEEITNYKIRKQNLEDEINRVKNSIDANKEKKIKRLEQKYSLGGLNFEAIVISEWPQSENNINNDIINNFETLQNIISGIRNLRKKHQISFKKSVELTVVNNDNFTKNYDSIISKLCNVNNIRYEDSEIKNALTFRVKSNIYSIPFEEEINVEQEIIKIKQDLEYQKGFLKSVNAKLKNKRFTENAPEIVIQNEIKKKDDALSKIDVLNSRLNNLEN